MGRGATGWLEGLTHLQASSGSAAASSAKSPGTRSPTPTPLASGLWPGKVVTKIGEAGSFWEAEPEDQGYLQH